jgi:hypothetical protein
MEKSEEYQKLYSLLAGLSSKGGSNTNEGITPQISLKDLLVGKNTVTKPITKPVAKPEVPPVVKKHVVLKTVAPKPAIKMPTVLVLDIPELVQPVKKEPVKQESKPKRKLVIMEEESEPAITCEACHKVFSSTLNRCRHMITSDACKKWLALPETDKNRPLMPPIHELVDKWLHDAISRPSDNLCQFCTTIFSNKGNLHKHYQTSTVCNRLAYLSFMKLMSSLNK